MAVQFKDYYEILGVSRKSSQEEIKNAFRKLARKYHPDVARDNPEAETRFKEINEAYEVLSNPETRRKYDQLGANWKHGQDFRPPPGWEGMRWQTAGGPDTGQGFEFHFGGTGFSDFFEQFFGGQRGGFSMFEGEPGGPGFGSFAGTERTRRGQDIEGDIMVSLHEALHGTTREVAVQRTHPRTGRTETRNYRVRIPPGVRDGQRIRLSGKGEAAPGGGQAGDLYLRVRFARHPDYRVHGSDLYYDLNLAPWDAVLGTRATIPALTGKVAVTIPPGAQQGQPLRVRGHGVPARGGARGVLYVVIHIQVPSRVTDEEKRLWQKLKSKSHGDPNR